MFCPSKEAWFVAILCAMADELTAKSSSLEAAIEDGKRFGVSPKETRRIFSLVKKSSASKIVKDYTINFDSDSDNDRAVWIHLIVDDDPNPSQEKVSELNKIANRVRSTLQQEELDIWPYVEVR